MGQGRGPDPVGDRRRQRPRLCADPFCQQRRVQDRLVPAGRVHHGGQTVRRRDFSQWRHRLPDTYGGGHAADEGGSL